MVALKREECGKAAPKLCREFTVSTTTFYKSRAQFGRVDLSKMAGIKEFEDTNRSLTRMCLV